MRTQTHPIWSKVFQSWPKHEGNKPTVWCYFGLMMLVLWTPQSNSRFQESLVRFLGATGHSHLFPSRLPKQLQGGLRTDCRNKIKTGPRHAPILGAVFGSKSGSNTLSFRLLFRVFFLKDSGHLFEAQFGPETCVETPQR